MLIKLTRIDPDGTYIGKCLINTDAILYAGDNDRGVGSVLTIDGRRVWDTEFIVKESVDDIQKALLNNIKEALYGQD